MNNIDKKEYRKAGKGWWNTYEVKSHFDVMFYLMDYDYFPGATKDVYKLTGMNRSSLNSEIVWVQNSIQVKCFSRTKNYIFQDYYGDSEDAVVMCHNDLHPGNVMINKAGEMDPAELVFIDYDNAGYGYRAFDLIYNMLSWPFGEMSDEATRNVWYNAYIADYVEERKKLGDAGITTQQIDEEVYVHMPYMILERMVFAVAFGFGEKGYMDALGVAYADEAKKRNHTIQYSSAVSLQSSLILPVLAFLLRWIKKTDFN